MREKDFYAYSAARKGLRPRALILNNAQSILDELRTQWEQKNIKIVEVGFNHGNDSRFICEEAFKRFGDKGWYFIGYDYERFFMPENLIMDESLFPNISSCIKAIPCTLEDLANNVSRLPSEIDFFYSSKTLTLCCKDMFYKLMKNICRRISSGGFLLCSLHTKVDENDEFPTYDELFQLVSCNDGSKDNPFHDFSIVVQPNTNDCNFAFIAKKTGCFSISENNDRFENDSQIEYVKKAEAEKNTIFLT